MTLSIRTKLLLLLVAVGAAVLLVGGTLAWYTWQLHERESTARLASAQAALASVLVRTEDRVLAHAGNIAGRSDLVASLNMIVNYQSKHDYRPFVFDPEKRAVAGELEDEIRSHGGEAGRREIVVYDGNGDLVAFAGYRSEVLMSGYVGYRNGEPQVHLLKEGTAPAPGPVPGMAMQYPGAVDAAPFTRYVVREGELNLEGSAPVQRRVPGGEMRAVGRVVIHRILDASYAARLAEDLGTHMAVIPPGADRTVIAGHVVEVPVLAGAAAPADTAQARYAPGAVETEALYLGVTALPLAQGDPALLALAIDKAPVLAQIERTRNVVVIVLLLSLAVVLPLGVLASRRSIAEPVRRLVQAVQAVEQGSYQFSRVPKGDDELGILGRRIREMADTIRRREQQLEASRANLQEAQRVAHLGNWEWHGTAGLVCSDEVFRIFGGGPAELGSDYRFGLARVHEEDRLRLAELRELAAANADPFEIDYRLPGADGRVQMLHEQVEVQETNGERRLFGTVQVVTELRQVELALRKSNRALTTLSRCNQALVHAQSERELLDDVVGTLVTEGEYRLAWVGFAEQGPEKRIVPVVRAGAHSDYVGRISVSWADTLTGRSPAGKAIRSGEPQVMRDILHDPDFAYWRDAARECGFASVIAFPLVAADGKPFGVLNVYAGEPNAFDDQEIALLRELAGDLAYGITILRVRESHDRLEREKVHYVERMHESMLGAVQALATTIEMRDPYTAGHQQRVADLSAAIARELGHDDGHVQGMYLAGLVHDVGKIKTPADILSRPGKLDELEFSLIKTHPQAGCEILQDVEFPWPVAEAVYQHHERLDGSGYPRGLKGGEILREAQILAVADVVEAMASHRPYRPALGVDAALAEVQEKRGLEFDPEVVDACTRVFRERGFEFG